MEIKTKYNIGDGNLYTMHDNRIVSCDVDNISVCVEKIGGEIISFIKYEVCYFQYDLMERFTVNEEDLYETKDELVDFLLGKVNKNIPTYIKGPDYETFDYTEFD